MENTTVYLKTNGRILFFVVMGNTRSVDFKSFLEWASKQNVMKHLSLLVSK